ncbi:MAG: hypothetical protein ACE5KD_00510 [Candidatus Bathyarchaeia archaeon]
MTDYVWLAKKRGIELTNKEKVLLAVKFRGLKSYEKYTGLSSPTIRKYLYELEDEGSIVMKVYKERKKRWGWLPSRYLVTSEGFKIIQNILSRFEK